MAEDTKHEVIRAATTVYPVLLVRDEIGDTITINQRLQKSFGEFLDGGSVCKPLSSPLFACQLGCSKEWPHCYEPAVSPSC